MVTATPKGLLAVRLASQSRRMRISEYHVIDLQPDGHSVHVGTVIARDAMGRRGGNVRIYQAYDADGRSARYLSFGESLHDLEHWWESLADF